MRFKRKNNVTCIATLILLVSITSTLIFLSSSITTKASYSKSFTFQFQTVHEENIVVSSNETRIIDYEYYLIGNVTIKDNATLIIQNTFFNLTSTHGFADILVKDHAKLVVTNSTLRISSNSTSKLLIRNHATLEISNSKIENPEDDISIILQDSSSAYIENTVISSSKKPKIVVGYSANDNPGVHIKNSTLNRIVVWGLSTVFVEKSIVQGAMRIFTDSIVHVSESTIEGQGEPFAITVDGSASIQIRDSIIRTTLTARENSEAWLIHTKTKEVRGSGNAKVWLINTSVDNLYHYDDATIFAGWELPLIGIITVPYTLAPLIEYLTYAALAAVALILLYLVIRKLKKRRLEKLESSV